MYFPAATSNGINDRGIFAGGYTTGYINVIQYITISSTGNATDFGDLSRIAGGLAAVSNVTTDRGVFGGGLGGLNVIEYITISSTGDSTDFGDLTVARYGLDAVSNV